MIEGLISKGYAYHSGGNIYFDTSKLSSYYVLSNHNEKDLAIAVRDDVSEDNNKKTRQILFCGLLNLNSKIKS